jgi:hypothetical protein
MASPKGEVERRVERIGAAGDGIAWAWPTRFTSFMAVRDRVRAVLGACRDGGHEGMKAGLSSCLRPPRAAAIRFVGVSGRAMAARYSTSMPRPTERRSSMASARRSNVPAPSGRDGGGRSARSRGGVRSASGAGRVGFHERFRHGLTHLPRIHGAGSVIVGDCSGTAAQ